MKRTWVAEDDVVVSKRTKTFRAARRAHLDAMANAVEKNNVQGLRRMVEDKKTFVTEANVEKARRFVALRQAAFDTVLTHQTTGRHVSENAGHDLASLAYSYQARPKSAADAVQLASFHGFMLDTFVKTGELAHYVESMMAQPVPPLGFDSTRILLLALKRPGILELLLSRSRAPLSGELVFAAMSKEKSDEKALEILLKARPKLVDATARFPRAYRPEGELLTPLQASAHEHIEDEHVGAFRTLLDAGADATVEDEEGMPAIHVLCGECQDSSSARRKLRELLAARRDAVDVLDGDGYTPLRFSVRYNYPIAIEMLVRAGARNLREKNKPPLFHVAVNMDEFGSTVVPLLRKAGANIDAVNAHGKTALHKSRPKFYNSSSEHSLPLLQHGAKVNIRDANGRSALHNALEHAFHWKNNEAHHAHVERLLNAGSDPHMKDRWGKTPFDVKMKNADKQHWLQYFRSRRMRVPNALLRV